MGGGNDASPERPGRVVASILGQFAMFCEEASPIMPDNITMDFFHALADDPEFDLIAQEVLNKVRDYAIAANDVQVPVYEAELVPQIKSMRIDAAFGNATAATGVIAEGVAVVATAWSTFERIKWLAGLCQGPMIYAVGLTCGLGLFYEISKGLRRHGFSRNALRVLGQPKVILMAAGLLFAGYDYSIKLRTGHHELARGTNPVTPFGREMRLAFNPNNDAMFALPDGAELAAIERWYQHEFNEGEKLSYERLGWTNSIKLAEYYRRHGRTPPVVVGERGLRDAFRGGIQATVDGIESLHPYLEGAGQALDVLQERSPGEQQMNQIETMIAEVERDFSSGERRYEYFENMRFFNTWATGITGFLGLALLGQSRPLYDRLVKLYDQLMDGRYVPYFPNAGPGPVNYQDDINEAARIIMALARRRAYADMSEDTLLRRMQELLAIRKDADRHRAPLVNPNNLPLRGELTDIQGNRVYAMKIEAQNARFNHDQNNPGDMINASCAGGSSSVVDAVFARVGL